MTTEKPTSKGQAWFCAPGLPSDVLVEVEDMTFHLHKFPLMSKSRKLHQLITDQETNPTQPNRDSDKEDEIEEIQSHIILNDFPGGSETFEMAAKFCYSVKMEFTASNVVPLRCAGEFLEMTEDYSEENLISKTELFLSESVLEKSVRDSIKALKSCEKVLPEAEALGIVEACIESIASKASTTNPALFGWPVNDNISENKDKANSVSNQALWNGIESTVRRKRGPNADTWLEELGVLTLPLFKRLIVGMKSRDSSPDLIETCLMFYAKKYIPGISRLNRKPSSTSAVTSETEQRELLETIVSNLPSEKTSTNTTRFLFGLLRTANILNASERCRFALEKKIGSQLEQATLDDLLIPSYSYLNETLYDVDCVERILGYFLNASGIEGEDDERNVRSPALMLVGKLIDGYLAEIASDANLKPDRFYNLAMSLPEQARLFDDGLYRAVDVYLKAHPGIAETERDKICGVMECQKLTLEACTHAAQNERLPLRAVVQVLFFEQLQLRHAIAGTLIAAENTGRASGEEVEEGGRWREAVRENQVLRLDMDGMRTRVHELERECWSMKRVIEKIDKEDGESGKSRRGWRGSLSKKFGCKFKTQVCDSHEEAVVNVAHHHHHHQQ